MTPVSERMYGVICKFCGNCDSTHCLADVPYYAVTVFCNFFSEKDIVVVPKRSPSIRRIIKRTLVETF
jgi:hypothetical protein